MLPWIHQLCLYVNSHGSKTKEEAIYLLFILRHCTLVFAQGEGTLGFFTN